MEKIGKFVSGNCFERFWEPFYIPLKHVLFYPTIFLHSKEISIYALIQKEEWGPYPLENLRGFLVNTGSDSLENHKSTQPAFNDVLI